MSARFCRSLVIVLCLTTSVFAQQRKAPATLPGTKPLTIKEPLDEVMVAGINRFAERELKASVERRRRMWNRDYRNPKAYATSVSENRDRLKKYLGVVDARVKEPRLEILHTLNDNSTAGTNKQDEYVVQHVRWRVLRGLTAEGLILQPAREPRAFVIALPDADWTPEQFCGLDTSDKTVPSRLVQRLVQSGCLVVIPTLINRDKTLSGHPDVRYTNEPHREFVYRMAFEMGRHVIGYEVQKVLAAVDAFAILNAAEKTARPIGVVGAGEGGLIAQFSAAIDPRIDAAMICGYFNSREDVWKQPIYRNVWAQLTEFGDADLASLIAPRTLIIEACAAPEIDGPPKPKSGQRPQAAPGAITTPKLASVTAEFKKAKEHFDQLKAGKQITLAVSEKGIGPAGTTAALKAFLTGLRLKPATLEKPLGELVRHKQDENNPLFHSGKRHERQFREMMAHVQNLLRESPRVRDHFWSDAKRTSVDEWQKTSAKYRRFIWEEMIGRLPAPTMPMNVRTRKVIDEPTHVGYEVVIDVYPDVIAAGILLLPKDLKKGEKRPVVVCQHGLEGTPMSTITMDKTNRSYGAYKGFSTVLAKRGFIVYAPQNPYRGRDNFRVIQRKSNPLKRSLFSYIIPQHQRTLNWLASLPNVDSKRIGFYGLSYGGKTAVRVPPVLVPNADGKRKDAPQSPGYCLSICSADFNEWVKKNTSNEDRYSYIFTGEYEIFEWNMGHTANYAELSSLMTPRPFMVERGHDDGVAPDEWVAWEYAKVRRHYDKLGLGDRTQIEFFNGPHTINGKGTYDFLHRHLKWPKERQLENQKR